MENNDDIIQEQKQVDLFFDESEETQTENSSDENQQEEQDQMQEDLIESLVQKKKEFTLSNPRESEMNRLKRVRNMNFLQRIFRPIKRGSLRGVIIFWIRMTMGVGILTLPKLIQEVGFLTGVIFLMLGCFICFFSYKSIFYASEKIKAKEYSQLVQILLPDTMNKIFKITYFLDMESFTIVYSIFGWKIFEFLLESFNWSKQSWYLNGVIDEYNYDVMLYRGVFYIILYIILIPFLLQDDLNKMKPIAFIFLLVLCLLLVDLMIEAPFFRSSYIQQEKIHPEKKFTMNWISNNFSLEVIPIFFSMILSFYVQPFVLILRKELLAPSFKRLNKVAFLSVVIELFMYIGFGFFMYYCFGNENLPELIILRIPYVGKSKWSEWLVIVLIFLFFLMNNIGLSMYNPGLKLYLKKFIILENKKITHLIISLLPMLTAFIVAFFLPNVLDMFWIIGLIICNFNGFIIPASMRLSVHLREKGKRNTKMIVFCSILITFYIVSGILGVLVKSKLI